MSAAFGRFKRNVWNQIGTSETTKIKVYQAIVLTALLYGCETWTTYQWNIKKLNHFHMTCLRKILDITLQKLILDTKVLTWASLPSISTILMQSQLYWASHVVCKKDYCLPKKLLYSKLSQGRTPKEARKSASKRHWRSPWNLSVSPLIAQDRDK